MDQIAESQQGAGPQPRRCVAERVRTVLARGAGGTVEAGMLRRPVRSARVRDDGVVVVVVDLSGVSRDPGDSARTVAPGTSATVEVADTVCTGRCRASAARPSFALDGRPAPTAGGCDDDCAVSRGVVTLSGIVTASTGARRRGLVAADGGGAAGGTGAGRDDHGGALRLAELQPLEVTYLTAEGVHLVSRADLSAAAVDPVGVDERAWLRRLASDTGLAPRLALRAGRQIAGTDPRIVGLDRFGVDLSVRVPGALWPDVVRVPFAQVCASAADVERELAGLAG